MPTGTAPNRASATILSLSALTLVLGFALQLVLAAKLGTGRKMDIYLVAITLPTLIAAVAGIVFPSALVPLLKEKLVCGSDHALEGLFGGVAGLAALAALVVMLPIALAAGPFVRLVAPGFDSEAVMLAARLLRFMLVGSFFDALRGVQTATFYARERFWLPQLVPSLNHAVMLASALWLLGPIGLPGLALGWTAGSVMMFAALVPGTVRASLIRSSFFRWNRDILLALQVLVPTFIVTLFGQATPVIDRLIASSLPTGSISYLGYGSKMLEIMMRTAPMAVALGTFPGLSAQAAGAAWGRFEETVTAGLRRIVLTAVPLAVLVALLREPMVTVLFQRGAFDQRATAGVAQAIGWYALAFVPAAAAYFLSQAVYATKRAWTLARLGLAAILLNAVLDFVLAKAVGFTGIAIAYLAVSLALSAALVGVLRKRFAGLRWRHTLEALVQAGVAATAMTAILLACRSFFLAPGDNALALAVKLATTAALALLGYCVVLPGVGNHEARSVATGFRRAVRRLFGQHSEK